MSHTHLQAYFFIVLFSAVLVLTVFIFAPFFNALVVAGVLSVLFRPLYKLILRATPSLPVLSALLTVILVMILILGPVSIMTQRVFVQATEVYASVVEADTGEFLNTLKLYIENALGRPLDFEFDLAVYVEQILSFIISHSGNFFASFTRTVISLFVGLLTFFYLLRDGHKLKKRLIELSPLSDNYDTQIFDKLQNAVNSVIRGAIVIAVSQGILTGVGLAIFGVPNPALWGTIAMVTALIPGIGTAIVIVPSILFLIISGHPLAAIGLAIWGLTAVGLIDNFLGPRLIGDKIKVHPILILLSVLGGISLFGPIGFLAGPLILSLLFALLDIYGSIFSQEQPS